MAKGSETSRKAPPLSEQRSGYTDEREILMPYEPDAGSLTAVKNVLLQSSLAELKAHGHYERYASLIEPQILEQLLASLGPGWVPVELALAHYEACDNLMLTPEQFALMGQGVGTRVKDAVLISLAKKVREANYDLWLSVGPLNRMWPRLFQGGSVQVSKVGPKAQLIEQKGYVLNRYHYYRQSHISAVRATYDALGATSTVKLLSYSAARDEMVVHVSWL
jgi:hypothetical protein